MNEKKKKNRKKKGNTNNWLAADHVVYGSVLYTVELYLSSGLVMSVIANWKIQLNFVTIKTVLIINTL